MIIRDEFATKIYFQSEPQNTIERSVYKLQNSLNTFSTTYNSLTTGLLKSIKSTVFQFPKFIGDPGASLLKVLKY